MKTVMRTQRRVEPITRETIHYWWAYAVYQGKLLIDGWYPSENEAYQFASRRIPVHFEVVELATRDKWRATRAIKHLTLEATNDIDFAIKRARHTKPEEGL